MVLAVCARDSRMHMARERESRRAITYARLLGKRANDDRSALTSLVPRQGFSESFADF